MQVILSIISSFKILIEGQQDDSMGKVFIACLPTSGPKFNFRNLHEGKKESPIPHSGYPRTPHGRSDNVYAHAQMQT